ncbi:hypothetical protein Tco_1003718 [Tanacetum coccineum]|uniref:Uncharacterized protein n=1 Tax=Tanacetum coccineum TaxID=301880 RepID=A0ABQ5FA74_9ASTR
MEKDSLLLRLVIVLQGTKKYGDQNSSDGGNYLEMEEITVVILVRDRCPRGKDNLPRLPIRTNIEREVEHSKPGFELQGAKMVETGQNRDFQLRTARVTTPGLRKGPLRLKVCLKSEMGHVYKLGRDVEKLVDVVYKLGSSFGEVFGIGGVVAEVEHSKPGFELQGAKMVETGQNRDFRLRTARVTTPGLRFLVSFASFLYLRLLKIY